MILVPASFDIQKPRNINGETIKRPTDTSRTYRDSPAFISRISTAHAPWRPAILDSFSSGYPHGRRLFMHSQTGRFPAPPAHSTRSEQKSGANYRKLKVPNLRYLRCCSVLLRGRQNPGITHGG
jgi:hypothetical protein